SSGYESGGYGLSNLEGTPTERAVALGKLAKVIHENGKLFASSKPVKAQVALVYNRLFQMVGGTRRVVVQGVDPGPWFGWFRYCRTLSDQNIPVDFIHRRDLESGNLSHYKLIILPYALMLTQKAADGIKNFVANGGYAFSEARLAWNNEYGFTSPVIPGLGLAEVFGVRESKVKTLEKVTIKIPDNTHPSMRHLQPDDIIQGSMFAESVEPYGTGKNTRILATLEDGSAGIVTSTFGKGHTLYVGSFLALANSRGSLWDQSTQRLTVQDEANKNTNQFLMGLVDWAGIERPYTAS